jgi:uncharacterized protein (DUF302 family)
MSTLSQDAHRRDETVEPLIGGLHVCHHFAVLRPRAVRSRAGARLRALLGIKRVEEKTVQSDTRTDPAYSHTAHLHAVSFEDARSRVTDALKQQGFGILTEIDVTATLKTKLNVAFRRYVILGACNPQLAHRALEVELAIGLLLPCNVCVWEDDGGSVVSIARPEAMFEIVKNDALQAVAREADQRLRLALDHVKGK